MVTNAQRANLTIHQFCRLVAWDVVTRKIVTKWTFVERNSPKMLSCVLILVQVVYSNSNKMGKSLQRGRKINHYE